MNWQEFVQIWVDSAPHPAPVFYRLYYDDQGRPLVYTMEDLPGRFIEIDKETYAVADINVKVSDGKIVKLTQTRSRAKLTPALDGTPCDPRDVSVVVSGDQTNIRWKLVYEN